MARDLERAGLAPRTRKHYTDAVSFLVRFHGRSPEELTPDDIRAWEDNLLDLGLGPNTRRVYLAGVAFSTGKPYPGLKWFLSSFLPGTPGGCRGF
jgi:hypothetical protein